MKQNRLLISASILLAAAMTGGVAFSQSSGTKGGETIHPDVNESTGGSKSERGSGGVPLPKGSPSSGTVEKGKSGSTTPNASKSSKPNVDDSKKSNSGDTTKGKDTDQPNQTPQSK